MSELKACPFCGGKSFISTESYNRYSEMRILEISCITKNCGSLMREVTYNSTNYYSKDDFRKDAANKWNTRYIPESMALVPMTA